VPELLPVVPEVVPVIPLAPVVPLGPVGVPLGPAARSVPVGFTPVEVLPALPVGLVGPVLVEPAGADGLAPVEPVLPEEPALCAKASGALVDNMTAVNTATIGVVRMARSFRSWFTTSTRPARRRSEICGRVRRVKSENVPRA